MEEQEKDMMELDVNLANRLVSNENKEVNTNDINDNSIKKDDNIDDAIVETIEVGDNAVEDDDVLKGVAIGDNDEFLNNDSDDDDGPVFHIAKIQKANSNTPRRLSSDRGAKSYVRPQQPQLMSSDIQNGIDDKNINNNDDEIKKLRYPHHRTAFDIVLDDLDVNETPWRSKQIPVDLSDYFNYGFNEHSWKIYAERQLKYRAYVLKLGPPALYARPVAQQAPVIDPSIAFEEEYVETTGNENKVDSVKNEVKSPLKSSHEPPVVPQPKQQYQPPMYPPGVPPSMYPPGIQQPMYPPPGVPPHMAGMWGMDPRFNMQHQPQGMPPHANDFQNFDRGGHDGMRQDIPRQEPPHPNDRRGGRDDKERDKRDDDRNRSRRDDGRDRGRRDDDRDRGRRDDIRDRDRRDDDRDRGRRDDDRRGTDKRRDDRRLSSDKRRSRSRSRDRRR